MSMIVEINFEKTYEPNEVATDLSYMTFYSEVTKFGYVLIKIEILSLGDPLLPNVFNMSFGLIYANGSINDNAKIDHQNKGKLFSTILLFALMYLRNYPHITIGIDGSNDVRAYLYHRMCKANREYLSEYFIPIGVDWYVKLLRNGNIEFDIDGYPYFKPKSELFDFERLVFNLYRYYMMQLK
jgi:hypothetical protein